MAGGFHFTIAWPWNPVLNASFALLPGTLIPPPKPIWNGRPIAPAGTDCSRDSDTTPRHSARRSFMDTSWCGCVGSRPCGCSVVPASRGMRGPLALARAGAGDARHGGEDGQVGAHVALDRAQGLLEHHQPAPDLAGVQLLGLAP